MRFKVLSLYAPFIEAFAQTGVIGRAVKSDLLCIESVDIRSYSKDPHRRVDDYSYGGGPGMVMAVQPVYDAVKAAKSDMPSAPVVCFTPAGQTFNTALAKELSKEEGLIFLCGHYEGFDERIMQLCCDRQVSMGDYILTGGHLAACVAIDAIARYLPGVLGNESSSSSESFENGLLEYPQYTRPPLAEGIEVPFVLLSGDHAKIEDWRYIESLEATRKARPDLFDAFVSRLKASWKTQKRKP